MNLRDSPQLKATTSNLKRKNRLEDNSDTPPQFNRRNRLKDYSLKRVIDSQGNPTTERALAFKKFKARQDRLRDDLLDLNINEEATDAFLKKFALEINAFFGSKGSPGK